MSGFSLGKGDTNNKDSPPPKAHPSISAEQQWLQSMTTKPTTVVAPTSQCGKGQTCPLTRTSSREATRNIWGPQVECRAYDEKLHHGEPNSFVQTPAQMAAEQRLELMQREMDTVIGMMRLNFEEKCVVSPDRRLSELYHIHCPDYKKHCGEKGLDNEGPETKRKRRRYRIQMCLFLGLILANLLFLVGDIIAQKFVISHESEQELRETRLKESGRRANNQTHVFDAAVISAIHQEATTVTIITEIDLENVKATLLGDSERTERSVGGDVNQGTKDLWGILGLEGTFPIGHGVLDPAQLAEKEQEAGGKKDEEIVRGLVAPTQVAGKQDERFGQAKLRGEMEQDPQLLASNYDDS